MDVIICHVFAFHTVVFLVDIPPVIVQHPRDRMVEFHFDIHLRCSAIGNNLKYQWTYNNITIAPNSRFTIADGGDIIISNAQLSDSGQYQCEVSNSGGIVTSRYATVLVVARGELCTQVLHSSDYFQIVPAPHVLTHPTDTSAAAPFSAVFTCSASAFGYLNIIWYKNNEVYETVLDKSEITLSSSGNVTTSNLIILNVTINDSGDYFCETWANDRATRSNVATLYYAGTCY